MLAGLLLGLERALVERGHLLRRNGRLLLPHHQLRLLLVEERLVLLRLLHRGRVLPLGHQLRLRLLVHQRRLDVPRIPQLLLLLPLVYLFAPLLLLLLLRERVGLLVAVAQQLRLRVLLLLLHEKVGMGLLEVEAVVQIRWLILRLEGQPVLRLVHAARVLAFYARLLLVLQGLLGRALRNWVLRDRRRSLVQERQLLVVLVGRVYVPRVSTVLKLL